MAQVPRCTAFGCHSGCAVLFPLCTIIMADVSSDSLGIRISSQQYKGLNRGPRDHSNPVIILLKVKGDGAQLTLTGLYIYNVA
jgi:hypothetical protein